MTNLEISRIQTAILLETLRGVKDSTLIINENLNNCSIKFVYNDKETAVYYSYSVGLQPSDLIYLIQLILE